MTTHANCTHEKTKAARAACRKGSPHVPRTAAEARRRGFAGPQTGEPTGPKIPLPKRTGTISGFCGNETHDRCPGGGKQWHCDCDCHTVPAAE